AEVTPTPTPVVEAQVLGTMFSAAPASPGELPRTGGHSGLLALAGIAFIGLGGALVALTGRTSTRQT
ncbi:MAG: LPXTG cell wall anchor domain-containing protein, partial [Actinomycetota bacterium]|nr:LPXTG cell wall anchor domain-containing protein [Actinomycetota bacterium]